MRTLLFIRIQQFKEWVNDKSWPGRVKVMGVLITFLISLALIGTQKPFLYLLLPALLCLFLQWVRSDYALLRKTGLTISVIIFIEYLLICSPFLIASILLGNIQSVIFFLLFLIMLQIVFRPGRIHL